MPRCEMHWRPRRGGAPMRKWTPGPPSDFDDLIEAPRWQRPTALVAVVVYGAVLSSIGLITAIDVGRTVPNTAFAIPGVLAALAAALRVPWDGFPREKT